MMKGLEISKSFYNEYGLKMLKEQFPELLHTVAIGLIGAGSECFGFDDDISTDHDFDPGFQIFISDDIGDNLKFKLERAYAKLPMVYGGYRREVMSPVGGNRRGLKRISDFLYDKTGTKDGKLKTRDWFMIPEESLAELTNGEIWLDDSKILSSIRLRLSTFPEDIKLKKIAGELLIMAQSGQYNFERCISHNELGAARLAIYEFVNAAIHVAFLLNETYMPFYKWKFKAMRNLRWLKEVRIKSDLNDIAGVEDDTYVSVNIEEKLSELLYVSDEKIFGGKTIKDVNLIAKIYVDKLKEEGLTGKDDIYLEKQAYEVNNKIKDINTRNMHILSAV